MSFPVKVFSTTGSQGLGQGVAVELASRISNTVSFGNAEVIKFSNQNLQVKVDNVRGHFVVVLHTQTPPVNENLIELFALLDAISNSRPCDVLVAFPCYPYARSDRKNKPRISTMSARLANFISISFGIKRVLLLDPHDPHIKHYFTPAAEEVSADYLLATWLIKSGANSDNSTVVFGDGGAAKRYEKFPWLVGHLPIAYVDKVRDDDDERPRIRGVVGKVEGRDCILPDDEVLTGSSVVEAAAALHEEHVRSITVVAVHGVLEDQKTSALEVVGRLEASAVDRFLFTDSVPLGSKVEGREKFNVVTIYPLLAEAIGRTIEEKSLTDLFSLQNVGLYWPKGLK